ncbi:helicase, partial [candidate division Kazan bacterium]
NPFLSHVAAEREREIEIISRHVEISLNELIHRQNLKMAELLEQQQQDDKSPLLAANIKKVEDRIDELNGRLERRREELQMERQCMIGDIQYLGRAWVLPHPERSSPEISPLVKDDKIERIAVDAVIRYEQKNGREVESVEDQNRGFDLISRKAHPKDPKTATEVRFIEVKGRSAVGEVALTANEYKTAERLGKDYWLYVVFNCASIPEIHMIRDPVRLRWEPLVKVEHYCLNPTVILEADNE